MLCSLIVIPVKADILSPDQKAPPFARGSGAFALPLPLEGKPRVAVSQPVGNNAEDGVLREETSSFKKIGDETILVVEGTFGYKSPEGLPISVKWVLHFIMFVTSHSKQFFSLKKKQILYIKQTYWKSILAKWDAQSKRKVNIVVIEKWNIKTVRTKGRQNFFSGKAKERKEKK